ncbi:MAG: ArsR family transcriptional regulator [Candidatus Bathyarchaeota archaeon]|nr:ArsR family transcriptional regulator [Candidatus Bathyarchaeota archaeon]
MAVWRKSEKLIREVLMDGERHRTGELERETGLSAATLSRHLKRMVLEGKIGKKIDTESGEYPYPAYYWYTPERIEMNIAKADVIEAIDLLDDSESLRLLHGIIFTYILLKEKAEKSGVKLDNLQVLRDTVDFTSRLWKPLTRS